MPDPKKTVPVSDEMKKKMPDVFAEIIEHHVTIRIIADKIVWQHPVTGEDVEMEVVKPRTS